jgi:hypothetical protein
MSIDVNKVRAMVRERFGIDLPDALIGMWSEESVFEDEAFVRLLGRIGPFVRTGWAPELEEADADAPGARFGGHAWLADGESWPRCTRCDWEMPLFLQLDLAQLPASLAGAGWLQLFYCPRYDCEQHHAGGDFTRGQLVRVIEMKAPGKLAACPATDVGMPPVKVIVGWTELVDLPHIDELEAAGVALSRAEQTMYFELEKPERGDKVGGWPYWTQVPCPPDCADCARPMKMLTQIDSNAGLEFDFGGGGHGHVFRCETHHDRLLFTWEN